MAGYGDYTNLSKKFCDHIECTYYRRVLAIWNHCVPPPLHLPPPAATAQGQKFPQDDSIIGQALNLPIHFQSSGAQIVVVAVASLPQHRAVRRAVTPRQAAACVPSYDSLEKLVEKQIFFSLFFHEYAQIHSIYLLVIYE